MCAAGRRPVSTSRPLVDAPTTSSLAMAFKLLAFAAVLAVARAGYLGAPAVAAYAAPAYGGYAAPAYAHGLAAPAAITSMHSNILRTPGNLGQVSTYSKTIDTPYSSVSKSDVRVSNDALAYGATYHAPAYAAYAAAPAVHAAPVATYAAPVAAAYAAPVVKTAYAAPVAAAYAAPVAAAYATPVVKTAYAAPVGAAYAAPVVKTAATAVAGHGLLGVAYSAAPVVSHMTYSNAYGIHYTY